MSTARGSCFYDRAIKAEADALRDAINTSCTLHAFVNDLVPSLASSVGDFVEPTFTGYTPFPMTGAAPEPEQIGPSTFQITTIPQHWDIDSETGEIFYGVFITIDGEMFMAARVDVPFALPLGDVLNVRVRLVAGQLQLFTIP